MSHFENNHILPGRRNDTKQQVYKCANIFIVLPDTHRCVVNLEGNYDSVVQVCFALTDKITEVNVEFEFVSVKTFSTLLLPLENTPDQTLGYT